MKLLERLQGIFQSRGAATSPWGKLDAWMDGFRVEAIVKQEFRRRAAQMNKGPSELLRECMRLVAFGPEEVKRMQDAGVNELAGLLGQMFDKKSDVARR